MTMDFLNHDENINQLITGNQDLGNQNPISEKPPVRPDDPDAIDTEVLHQTHETIDDIFDQVEASRIETIPQIENENIENTQAQTIPVVPVTQPSQSFIQPLVDNYEVLMPRDYWEKNIIQELEKYGLPSETQPTDFFNYLLINRAKLLTTSTKTDTTTDSTKDNVELKATAKILESIIALKTRKSRKNTTWVWVALMVFITVIVAGFYYFRNKISSPKSTSWIK